MSAEPSSGFSLLCVSNPPSPRGIFHTTDPRKTQPGKRNKVNFWKRETNRVFKCWKTCLSILVGNVDCHAKCIVCWALPSPQKLMFCSLPLPTIAPKPWLILPPQKKEEEGFPQGIRTVFVQYTVRTMVYCTLRRQGNTPNNKENRPCQWESGTCQLT